jgi:hypothetical protein
MKLKVKLAPKVFRAVEEIFMRKERIRLSEMRNCTRDFASAVLAGGVTRANMGFNEIPFIILSHYS